MQLDRIALALAQQISGHKRIISFHHILVHGYDSLAHEIVWAIVVENYRYYGQKPSGRRAK